MDRNFFGTAWSVLVISALLLLLFPLLQRQVEGLSNRFRSYDFLQSFLRDSTAIHSNSPLNDSSLLQPQALAVLPPPPPRPTYTGKAGLQTFFQALRSGKEQIRIAYFGDSAIEGDLICQTLRDGLQRRFGGSGVGLMPLSSHIKEFRRSIRHRTTGDWYRRMLGEKNWPGYPLGILGGYFLAGKPPEPEDSLQIDSSRIVEAEMSLAEVKPEMVKDPFQVSYRGVNLFPGLRQISKARLFYSAPIMDSLGYTAPAGKVIARSGDWETTYPLSGKKTVNQQWLSDSSMRKLELEFDISDTQPLFAVSIESPEGVIVDNIPSRGNKGGWLEQIPYYRFNAFDSLLDYDLVILQFGLNALAPEMENFSWYKSELRGMIRHIKSSFPNASILLIGPTDRGIKEETEVVADPSVPLVTLAMEEVAKQHKIAFFSFYDAMGGSGSIIDWVENKEPKWANLDYTHLSYRGAHEAGKLLLEYLLKDFESPVK